ncbi:peptidylprolyl isomerase [Pantoea sp. KXB25]|uniref:peptidylprolyl isomerase n=1 Tax=unclassified Pantoea TaxID=2630326 RepID=UPI003AB8CA1F
MNRRTFIGGGLGLCAGAMMLPALSQTATQESDLLEMELGSGIVSIRLFSDRAPGHVRRIKVLAQARFYDGMPFARVIKDFMAQTGDPGNMSRIDPRQLPPLAAEFSTLPFERGTVGMARSRHPHSATHQFFITTNRARYLDQNYTVFGKVTAGMDLIDQLQGGTHETGKVLNPETIKRLRLASARSVWRVSES